MHLEFNYTPEDLNEFRRLRRKFRSRAEFANRIRHAFIWLLFSIAIVIFGLLLSVKPTAPQSSDTMAGSRETLRMLIPPVLLLILAAIFIISRSRWAKRTLAANSRLQIPQLIDIDDNGIVHSSATSRTTWEWLAFSGMAEGPRLLLLKISGSNSFLMIPKRAVPGPELIQLRAHLRKCIQPATHAFPVVQARVED